MKINPTGDVKREIVRREVKWKIDNLSACWFAVVEGAVQVLHSTPLHTSLEMFHPAKVDSRLSAVGGGQLGKSKQIIARLVAKN